MGYARASSNLVSVVLDSAVLIFLIQKTADPGLEPGTKRYRVQVPGRLFSVHWY